jgi:hypothetical protein
MDLINCVSKKLRIQILILLMKQLVLFCGAQNWNRTWCTFRDNYFEL